MRIKNLLRNLCVAAAVLFLASASAKVFAAPVTVNLNTEYQWIHGLGGINHVHWTEDLTEAQRNTAFGNGPNQLGFTVLRVYIDESSSNWPKELPTAKWASDRGITVFASPWNPPAGMRKTGQSTYNTGTQYNNTKMIRNDRFPEYVAHLNSFIKYMADNGVDLYAVSVQNEPDYAYHGEWTEWTASDILTFMKSHAGNINSRVITPEPFQYRKNELNLILNDPAALANTDIVGTHLYGTLPKDFAYPLFKQKGAGKELWMTEVYHPNSEADAAERWPEALNTAVHVHRALVDGGFQAYVWWYVRRSYSPILENGTISKRGWMMAHFSKFVRPKYVRVDATPAMPKAESPVNNSTGGTGGTFVSAYKGDSGKVVIVAVNRDAAASNIEFTIDGGAVPAMEAWRTTASQNMAKLDDVTLNNGSAFSVSLPAQSVTTFVGVAPSVNPGVTVTCDVDNLDASYIAGSGVPRPNVDCGAGITAGAASFSVSGSTDEITGWSVSGGTHNFYNDGTRSVVLNSLVCGGSNVIQNPPLPCGSFEVVPDPTTSIANSVAQTRVAGRLVSIKGRTLNVNSSNDSKVCVRLVNMMGKTVLNFNVNGYAKLSLKNIPAGAYIVEARRMRDGYRMTSAVMLK